MKAWIVENTSSDYWGDDWNEIVFADNYRQAKTKATYTSLFNGDYLNLRVKRYHDNYSDKREARIDFLKWYSKYYKESESNEID